MASFRGITVCMMTSFPTYVPKAVRGDITTLLEEWAGSLDARNSILEGVKKEIQICIGSGGSEFLNGLRIRKSEIEDGIKNTKDDVMCLERLAHDPRMREAFDLLTNEIHDENQLRRFIYAAWAARINFKKYRDKLKNAANTKEKIADAAENLAKLIRDYVDNGVDVPGVFYSIKDLLRQTDNNQINGYNWSMWRSMRHHIFGDNPSGHENSIILESKEDVEIIVDLVPPSIAEKSRNDLRYAWGKAPDLSELLDELARVAKYLIPKESGMIGAAVEHRQNNSKMEYLRAFGSLLTDEHQFRLTEELMEPIAILAAVVLDDIDVTSNDVKRALAQNSGSVKKTQTQNFS